jgi:hypothetical protein
VGVTGLVWAGRGVAVRLLLMLYMLVTALWSLPPWLLYSRYIEPGNLGSRIINNREATNPRIYSQRFIKLMAKHNVSIESHRLNVNIYKL